MKIEGACGPCSKGAHHQCDDESCSCCGGDGADD